MGPASCTAATAAFWACLSKVLTIRRPPTSTWSSVNPLANTSALDGGQQVPVRPGERLTGPTLENLREGAQRLVPLLRCQPPLIDHAVQDVAVARLEAVPVGVGEYRPGALMIAASTAACSRVRSLAWVPKYASAAVWMP